MASLKVGPLSLADQVAVRQLAQAATLHDGVAPLSEVPLWHLATDSPLITHVIVPAPAGNQQPDSQAALGYAQIDRSGGLASAELVVHPTARRGGIGRKLAKMAEADARMPTVSGAGLTAGKQLRVWAHGDLASAQGFATALGYEPVRELLVLSRPLTATSGATLELPTGYRFRTFRPGHDDEAWVQVNALAFADHPEQGRLTVADFQTRLAEPWFNPEDFHLITYPGAGSGPEQIAAFCWAKVPDNETGEIYAIGVHPLHRRRKLAAYLLQAAAQQMAAGGLKRTILYVEGNNEAALAAYYTAGFTPLSADIQYAKP